MYIFAVYSCIRPKEGMRRSEENGEFGVYNMEKSKRKKYGFCKKNGGFDNGIKIKLLIIHGN